MTAGTAIMHDFVISKRNLQEDGKSTFNKRVSQHFQFNSFHSLPYSKFII